MRSTPIETEVRLPVLAQTEGSSMELCASSWQSILTSVRRALVLLDHEPCFISQVRRELFSNKSI